MLSLTVALFYCSLHLQQDGKLLHRPCASLLFHGVKSVISRTKRAQHVTSPLPSALGPCTPTKTGGRTGSKVAPDMQTTSPELSKVTFLSELELLVEVYSTCISGKWPQGGGND